MKKNEFENSLVENKFENNVGPDYEIEKYFITKNKEKFLEKLYDKTIINESKTYDEMLKIATEKLNNISEKEILSFLNNQMELNKHKWTRKQDNYDSDLFIIPMNWYQEQYYYSKIENIKFDNKNKLVSFNISNYDFYKMKINDKEFTISKVISYDFENIKLKPIVYQFINELDKFYAPSFIFSDIQDMNPSIKLNQNKTKLIFDHNKIVEIIGYQYDNLKDKSEYTRDEYIQQEIQWEQYGGEKINNYYFVKYYSKNINEYFSVVDGVFNFDNKINSFYYQIDFNGPIGLIDDYYNTHGEDVSFDWKTGELLSDPNNIKPYYFSLDALYFSQH